MLYFPDICNHGSYGLQSRKCNFSLLDRKQGKICEQIYLLELGSHQASSLPSGLLPSLVLKIGGLP